MANEEGNVRSTSSMDNMNSTHDRFDSVDDGAHVVGGYTAAEAARTVQAFLEGVLSLHGLVEWLDGYPYGANGPAPREVEDEINRATLVARSLENGTRTDKEARGELMDVRSRLSGYAFQAGQTQPTGSTVSPSGRPVDRSFP